MNTRSTLLCATLSAALAAAVPASAEERAVTSAASLELEARNIDRDAVGQAPAHVERRIGADFAGWAGSTQNAQALVTGLREARPITLKPDAFAAAGSGGAPSTTFTPPTRPMGYGNVYIALALAKAQLEAQGITSPTPLQLQAALVGGATASPDQSKGVLQLRSEGVGWGRIAKAYDLKLGPVMADLKSTHQSLASPHGGVTTGTGASVRGPSSARAPASASAGGGIVTAAGGPPVQAGAKSHVSATGAAHMNSGVADAGARGIVNAGGGGAGTPGGHARGHFK